MAVVVAEGVVEVTTDGKNIPRMIARDIDNNSGPITQSGGLFGQRFSTAVGGGLARLGGIVAAAGLVVATGLGIGVGAVITNGVKFNAAMEGYVAAFTPLLGGADAAEAKLSELSTMAASTPFQLTDLASASQTLLAFGEDTSALLSDLQMLGNISQGNSAKLSGLALVFGQVQSNGKLMGQDLLQMINQGFNPLQVISEKTGESMSSLRDRMEKGQISFDEVRQAMVWATSEGGMFFNAMELGARTLTGAWSSTQDGASILSGAIVGKLSPALTGILNDGINPLLGGLLDLVNGVDGAQAKVDDASASLLAGVQSIVPAIGSIATNLSTVFTALAPALGSAIGAIVTGLVTILPSVIGLAGQIVTTLITTLAAQGPSLVAAAVPVILGFVTGLLGQLPTLIGAGIAILVTLVTGITDSLPTLIPAVVGAVVDSLLTLFAPENLTALLDAGLGLVMGLVTGLIAALPTLIEALPTIILSITDFLISSIPVLIDAGLQLFLALIGALPDIIVGIVSAIPQIILGINIALIKALPAIISGGIQLFLALITAMPTIIKGIVAAIPQIVTGIVTALVAAAPQLAQAGVQLIQGLWSGIASVASWLWGKVSGFMGQLVNKIKGFFGIASPSKLMHAEVGSMLGVGVGEGFIESLEGQRTGIMGALGSLVSGVAGGIGSIGVKVSGALGGDAGAGLAPAAPGGSEAGVMVGNGSTIIQIGTVQIDPTKIETLQDLIDMFMQLAQVARAGRPKPAGGF